MFHNIKDFKDMCQKMEGKTSFFFDAHPGYQEPGLLNVWKSLT